MSQVGAIVISDNINVAKFIELAKTDPKYIIGSEKIADDGTRYIPIEKN